HFDPFSHLSSLSLLLFPCLPFREHIRLEEHLHPLLARFMLSKFQSLDSNPNHAQIIFTTHSTDLLNSGLLQKGQIYVASKGKRDNSSTLTLITSEVKATGGIHHVD
ncbi:hypothetical protein AALA82_20040, partial [Oscillospiraceae bacterium 50-16]